MNDAHKMTLILLDEVNNMRERYLDNRVIKAQMVEIKR
jgi:hypothetical protein